MHTDTNIATPAFFLFTSYVSACFYFALDMVLTMHVAVIIRDLISMSLPFPRSSIIISVGCFFFFFFTPYFSASWLFPFFLFFFCHRGSGFIYLFIYLFIQLLSSSVIQPILHRNSVIILSINSKKLSSHRVLVLCTQFNR